MSSLERSEKSKIFFKVVVIDTIILLILAVFLIMFVPYFNQLYNDFKSHQLDSEIHTNKNVEKNNIQFYFNQCPIQKSTLKIKERELPIVSEYDWVSYGDSLFSILKRNTKLNNQDIYTIIQNTKSFKNNFTKLLVGQKYRINKQNDKIHSIDFFFSEFDFFRINLNSEYTVEIEKFTPDIQYKTTQGTLNSSLYDDASKAGLSNKQIKQFADIFAWDVDFTRDINKGDEFRVIYEEYYDQEHKFGTGKILAAYLKTIRGEFFAFGFNDEDYFSYYDKNGNNLQKIFLKSPVEAGLVTSQFTYERWHPILKTNRPHRGVDYGGRLNTPIMATSDGIIIKKRKESAYGNVVSIDHGNGFTTLYAHLNKFNENINIGDKVKQGDIIGYMGTTGLSTGVHLHYELRKNGKHQDPLNIELPNGKPVKNKELFEIEKNILLDLMFNKKEA